MRFLRNVLITVLWFAAFTAAIVGVLLTIPLRFPNGDTFRQYGQGFLTNLDQAFAQANFPDWLFLFWLLVLFLCLLVAAFAMMGRTRRLKIERIVDGGRVEMSPQATKHYIATALAPFSDLACRRIDLIQGRQGLEAVVHAQLRTQDDVPALERQLIDRVHSALTQDLGIANVSKVNVVIKDFGLPKGIQPRPVPAVPVPGMEERIAEPVAQTQPTETRSELPALEAPREAAPGQSGSGVYTAPAAGTEPAPITLSPAPEPMVNEKGNLVLPASPAETTTDIVPVEAPPPDNDEERKPGV